MLCTNVCRASLVPVISFGENELYGQLRKGIIWGRFPFGYIPLRRPVVTVGELSKIRKKSNVFVVLSLVGKAIHADSQDIDELHEKYIHSVEQLFNQHKDKYGLGHVNLQIV